MIQREAATQKHVMQFVRENLPGSEFFAFDRSAPSGRFTHMREKARGVRKGTPDTLLRIAGYPNIWAELKAPGKKPTDEQIDIGRRLEAVGDVWFFADSVVAYATQLRNAGVVMSPRWREHAEDHDARAQGEIERAMMKKGNLPARLEKRVTKRALEIAAGRLPR